MAVVAVVAVVVVVVLCCGGCGVVLWCCRDAALRRCAVLRCCAAVLRCAALCCAVRLRGVKLSFNQTIGRVPSLLRPQACHNWRSCAAGRAPASKPGCPSPSGCSVTYTSHQMLRRSGWRPLELEATLRSSGSKPFCATTARRATCRCCGNWTPEPSTSSVRSRSVRVPTPAAAASNARAQQPAAQDHRVVSSGVGGHWPGPSLDLPGGEGENGGHCQSQLQASRPWECIMRAAPRTSAWSSGAPESAKE